MTSRPSVTDRLLSSEPESSLTTTVRRSGVVGGRGIRDLQIDGGTRLRDVPQSEHRIETRGLLGRRGRRRYRYQERGWHLRRGTRRGS
ncbi:MAG: hypothetical protein V9G09_08185 [Candidatus Nanopelagicales bacterium]